MKPALTLLKIGGNVIDHPDRLTCVLGAFAGLETRKALVHGGGKLASDLMVRLGIQPKMADGRRITDRQTLDIVTMVYAGLINKNIVAGLQRFSCNAIGLSGADANIIPAVKRPVKEIDYGFAGDPSPENIGAETLERLLEMGLTPVLSPITHDGQGMLLNTNADTIASAVAVALSRRYEVHLVFCFEKNGVLRNPSDDASVIALMDESLFTQYKADGTVTAGMIPKLDNAFAALRNGVAEVKICSPSGLTAGGGTRIRLNLLSPAAECP
ncbi:MAG: acetylglutamate kinase [Bacteroidales bacterium]|jgi:acetylglutamate kinase|nr:acetylglutamate kinase [Bacteroidales bacterium]